MVDKPVPRSAGKIKGQRRLLISDMPSKVSDVDMANMAISIATWE